MIIRLFEPGLTDDRIELNVGNDLHSLSQVIKTLYYYTDIEQIVIEKETEKDEE